MVDLVAVEISLDEGAGPHQRHLARQNVPQLGQLVDRPAPQPAAYTGDTRVRRHLEDARIARARQTLEGRLQRVRAVPHGAKLQDLEGPTTKPHTFLSKQNGAGRVNLHEHRQQAEHRA